jgi:branched-subunit amino acid aminotransferase/4-amino-4-deoxychorismate lyase
LGRDGFVVEAVRHNIVWVQDGQLHYPAPELGAVAGTRLAWLLERIPGTRPIAAKLADFAKADAVAVLNAVRGVTPVTRLWSADDRTVLARWASHAHPLIAGLRSQAAEG